MSGKPIEIGAGAWLLQVPVRPMPATPEFTNCCFFIDDDGYVTVVDPGDDHEAALQTISEGLRSLGISLERVTLIMVTHLHCDHMGIAARLQRATGAEVAMHSLDREAVDKSVPAVAVTRSLLTHWGVPPDRWAELEGLISIPRAVERASNVVECIDGDVIARPGRRFSIVHTPGHTAGHIAILEEVSGIVMTGDVVLPDQNPGVGLGGEQTNPLGAYVTSLRRLRTLRHHTAVPGHGALIVDLAARCTELLDHQLGRAAEIAHLRRPQPDATVWSVAERLTWSRQWSTVGGARLRSALHHVDMHLRHLDATAGRDERDEK